MNLDQIEKARKQAIELYKQSKIFFTKEELENIAVIDLSLGDFYNIGVTLVTYVDTDRVGARELAILPRQTVPQHMHPNLEGGIKGKEETFRCRWGELYLYVDGPKTDNIKAKIPEKYQGKSTVFHEIVLKPGDQHTLEPGMWHWFQAGDEGAVVSEFTSKAYDDKDVFYDRSLTPVSK